MKRSNVTVKDILGRALRIIVDISVLVILILLALFILALVDDKTLIISKNDRIEQHYLNDTFKMEITNKEIENTTDSNNGEIISTYYIYFQYDNKIKRSKVTEDQFNNIRVGDNVDIKVNIEYSTTTGYIIKEEYEYIE